MLLLYKRHELHPVRIVVTLWIDPLPLTAPPGPSPFGTRTGSGCIGILNALFSPRHCPGAPSARRRASSVSAGRSRRAARRLLLNQRILKLLDKVIDKS